MNTSYSRLSRFKLITLQMTAIWFMLSLPPVLQAQVPSQDLQFKVTLDGKPIGSHRFIVRQTDRDVRVTTQATFTVKFLGFTAYRYQHTNSERWNNGCLKQITSSTDDNGNAYFVKGLQQDNRFQLQATKQSGSYPTCLKSFAYWHLPYLQTSQLLNSQTGELLPIKISSMGNEKITVNGNSYNAERHRITGQKLQIDLWYDQNKRWLALESLAEGGRVLRYERQ